MEKFGNSILVTGGGSGIGRALASEFHRVGNRVVIAGRRLEVLEGVAGAHPGMIPLLLDLAKPETIPDFAARLAADCPDLNVLVNNAGALKTENKIDLAVAEEMVATNLLGPIRLTAALLPHLLARPSATILNVSSSLGFVPLVHAPTYGAAKAALHSWTVSIREQLRATNIEVIELIPPAVQTELTPGQSSNPHALPLDTFIAETMAQLRESPTPQEICGARAQVFRGVVDAESFGRKMREIAGRKPARD